MATKSIIIDPNLLKVSNDTEQSDTKSRKTRKKSVKRGEKGEKGEKRKLAAEARLKVKSEKNKTSARKLLLNRISEIRGIKKNRATGELSIATKPTPHAPVDAYENTTAFIHDINKKYDDAVLEENRSGVPKGFKSGLVGNRTRKKINNRDIPLSMNTTTAFDTQSQIGKSKLVSVDTVERREIEPRSTVTQPTELPYGCLKNGKKPTYKMWNTTRKRGKVEPVVVPAIQSSVEIRDLVPLTQLAIDPIPVVAPVPIPAPIPVVAPVQAPIIPVPVVAPVPVQAPPIPVQVTPIQAPPPPKERTVYGKTSNRKVGVVIKNNATRKKINYERSKLSSKPISEIKKYLRDRGLIKYGSCAPSSLLHSMYIDSVLSGDLHNISNEVMVHNYEMRDEL